MLSCLLALERGSRVERTFAFFMVPASEVQDGCDRVIVCGSGDIITTAVLPGGTRDRLNYISVEIPCHIIYLALYCNALEGSSRRVKDEGPGTCPCTTV